MALFRPLILQYHAVSDSWDDTLAVPCAEFERQLQSLDARGFRGTTTAGALLEPGNPRLLHVTFDDAYASIRDAIPTLRRFGFPSTIFVCTAFAYGGLPLRIPELEQVEQVDELATLDWGALRELVDEGMVEVGSHTLTHAHLKEFSHAELMRELVDSKTAIADNLGRPCEAFAYPYGEQDLRVRKAVAAAGYTVGFGAPGVSLRRDRFQIPRTGFWRNESAKRQAVKTLFPARLAREQGHLRRRGSSR
jgi:peptidoglycan/xylan/chitin deacetylase (PgdA/CDA1 family)